MARARRFGALAALAIAAGAIAAGCTPTANPLPLALNPRAGQSLMTGGLAPDLAAVLTQTETLAASPGTGDCPHALQPSPVAVVRVALPEPVLFDTASDRPAPAADSVLDFIARTIHQDAPTAEVTVLGHTDAIGSEAYNIDLSRRRAATVLRALLARNLPPWQLSAVAIGKRQPIAENATPAGRARNRRVEFLISPCLNANLDIVRRAATSASPRLPGDTEVALNDRLDVLRLRPSETGASELRPVATIALRPVTPDMGSEKGTIAAEPPVRRAQGYPQASRPRPPAVAARPSTAPAYVPRTLAPDVEPHPLGPPMSY